MTIIDAITNSPLNVFFTIIIGIGLAYLYYRKPPSSSPSTSTSSIQGPPSHQSRAFTSAFRASPSPSTGLVDEELHRAIAQIERQERDMIRQEQDEAYQQSLKADREKKLKREQETREREAREREERIKAEQAQLLHKRLTKLKSEIKHIIASTKTTSNDLASIVKLVFKLPDGTRIKRDFLKTDKVKRLYWFVFSLDNAPLQFKLTTNFPKRDLPGRPPLPEDLEESVEITDIRADSSAKRRPSALSNTSNSNLHSEPFYELPETVKKSVDTNCEQTLEEIELTDTQIIFVHDLEA